jgi:hypothetical protein
LAPLVVVGLRCPESWAIANVRKAETTKSDKMLSFIIKIVKENEQMCRRTTERSFRLDVFNMRSRRLKKKPSEPDNGKA